MRRLQEFAEGIILRKNESLNGSRLIPLCSHPSREYQGSFLKSEKEPGIRFTRITGKYAQFEELLTIDEHTKVACFSDTLKNGNVKRETRCIGNFTIPWANDPIEYNSVEKVYKNGGIHLKETAQLGSSVHKTYCKDELGPFLNDYMNTDSIELKKYFPYYKPKAENEEVPATPNVKVEKVNENTASTDDKIKCYSYKTLALNTLISMFNSALTASSIHNHQSAVNKRYSPQSKFFIKVETVILALWTKYCLDNPILD